MAAKSQSKTVELETRTFASQQKWLSWLDKNHAKSSGLWLKFAKKGSGIPSVTYPEALEVALCYGWIDGQLKSLDATWYLQRFTPRRARSKWSKINCAKTAALIEQGRMQPAGLRQIEAAKADGRWDAAYDSPANAQIPEEFQKELDRRPKAKAFFATLSRVNRYAIIWRIQTAKKPETRERKIRTLIEMLEKGETIH